MCRDDDRGVPVVAHVGIIVTDALTIPGPQVESANRPKLRFIIEEAVITGVELVVHAITTTHSVPHFKVNRSSGGICAIGHM